jgi:hypothetical protein
MTKEDALAALRIASAHHEEIAELCTAEKDVDLTDTLLDAGDQMDMAIMVAYGEGAKLLELRRSAKHLSIRYLADLTEGVLDES